MKTCDLCRDEKNDSEFVSLTCACIGKNACGTCLSTWFMRNKVGTCPFCRATFFSSYRTKELTRAFTNHLSKSLQHFTSFLYILISIGIILFVTPSALNARNINGLNTDAHPISKFILQEYNIVPNRFSNEYLEHAEIAWSMYGYSHHYILSALYLNIISVIMSLLIDIFHIYSNRKASYYILLQILCVFYYGAGVLRFARTEDNIDHVMHLQQLIWVNALPLPFAMIHLIVTINKSLL